LKEVWAKLLKVGAQINIVQRANRSWKLREGETKEMAKDEIKAGREESKTGRRNGAMDVAENAPLVSAKRGKFATIESAKVEALVFARLADYKSFVAEIEGEEPEDGAIISAGLEMLFEADKSFERWATEQRRKGKVGMPSSMNGVSGGVPPSARGVSA